MRAHTDYQKLLGRELRGRFVLDEFIDQGGMGAVFRAKDREVGDTVAVKVLHPALAKESKCLARFIREGEAAMVLSHPHIVETRSMSHPDDDLAWFAMELLEGASLRHLRKRKHMFSASEIARIGRQVLSALDATHTIGLMHRDLKPANVMLVRKDGGDVAKLVDFGIAVFNYSDTYTRLTTAGTILGTPAYMPPEQLAGKKLDGRADVYGLAATLHTLMVGEPPFGRGSLAKLVPRILSGDREPLPVRCPDLAPLGIIIERGLRADRNERWQSAADMERALAPFDETLEPTILDWDSKPGNATLHLSASDFDEVLMTSQTPVLDAIDIPTVPDPPSFASITGAPQFEEAGAAKGGPSATRSLRATPTPRPQVAEKRAPWALVAALAALVVVAAIALATVTTLALGGDDKVPTPMPATAASPPVTAVP